MVGLWAWLLLQAAVVPPPLLDPNVVEFPDSSLVDFGPLRDGARKGHGYLKVDGQGHFVWDDGRRARFWGINVAVESVFQPFDRIDTCVDRIRRAGFNLVRIHHVDGTDRGILKPDGGKLAFDEPRLKCLDYWVDRLGRAGIGVYLDLLDFREFGGADGVLNAAALGRGAKPYAVFDGKLIALQQQYAKALLKDHVNPFNGLAYAADPAVVMLELFDENGLFIRRRDWGRLASPYVEELSRLWNAFLLKRYGSTEALATQWAKSGVLQPLFPGQRIEQGTVPLPDFTLALDTPPESAVDRLRRAQASDAARFAYDVHRTYYRTMREFLRKEVGVKVPLSAVGDGAIVPDLLAVAEELDFIGTNYYWDHPAFRAGREWQLPYFFRGNSPLTATGSEAFAPTVAAARMSRKPLVVREWNHCFPNPDRASGMLDAAAYAALQDVDAMVLFTYGTIPTQRKIGLFDVHQDPARWGVAGVLGEVFMNQAIAPARRSVELAYGDVDTFLFKDYRTDLRNLAWTSRVATRCFGAELQCDADLTINSGRSSAGVYRGGPLLLSRQDPTLSTACEPAWVTPAHFGYPLPLAQGGPDLYYWDGTLLYDQGVHGREPGGRFRLQEVKAAGARAVGEGKADAVGFRDDTAKAYGFGKLSVAEQAAAALDIVHLVYGDPVGRGQPQSGRYLSDTGEIARDTVQGLLSICAPRVVAVAGNLAARPVQCGELRIETGNTTGVAVVVSLDQRPLAQSRWLVARLAGNVGNTAMQLIAPGPQSDPPNRWRLEAEGSGPVVSDGRPAAQGWRIFKQDKLWFAVGLAGGNAEVVREGDVWRFYSDTPGAWLKAEGAARAVAVAADGRETDLPGDGVWQYPAGAAMVVLKSLGGS